MHRPTRRKRSEQVHVRQSRRTRRARRLLLESLEDRRLLAFDAHLVADINAVPSGDASSSPEYIVQVGGGFYFTAETPAAGRELWRSDGTAANTVLVKDIRPGPEDAFESGRDPYLTDVNGTLFFVADDGTNGFELWKSNGTEAGTELVKVINVRDGSFFCEPALLTEFNGLLFFRAGAATYDIYGPELDGGPELWVSDGTEAGTRRVKDINTTGQFGGSLIRELTNFNGTLFFNADDGTNGSELWKSDGTEAGTVMVKDIRSGSSPSGPRYLTNVNGTLFFSANDGIHGHELWKSNGTEAGTVLVKDIRSDSYSAYAYHLTNVNGTLFFRANDGTYGNELWKSDGTEAGTVLVKDLRSGGSSNPDQLTAVNSTLFFRANDGASGVELWTSDGTEGGTQMVKDIQAGGGSSDPSNLTNVNGTLFFQGSDSANGTELWKTDGTPANTVLVKDIRPGSDSADPRYLANINSTLFFAADDGSSGGELWKSDGTPDGTVLFKDIQTLPPTRSSSPWSLAEVGGTVFFDANDGTTGYELWKSDGTPGGTLLVKDINDGSGDSYPHYLTNVSGTLFFSANDGANGYQLWKSNGTSGGTVPVKNLSAGNWDSLTELTNVNGTLFFRADDGANGYELWKSDGTSVGTVLVKEINASGSSCPKDLTNVNGTLFFRADDGAHGDELWKSDGTPENTVLVKDINLGSADSLGSWSDTLTNVNGTLFFSANDGTHGYELWQSDGTAENTVLVKDVLTGSDGSYADYLTNVNGTLFFSADDGAYGYELWKSDGTAENTVLVKDIRPGDAWASSRPRSLSAVGGTLFFTAADAYGRELWKSDGTEANTVIVKDIWPGTTASYPKYLTDVNGALFFVAYEDNHGRELWTSDGSGAGTVLVKDIGPGSDSSYPDYLTAANGTLFFNANDGFHGRELWQAFPLASTPSLLAELDTNGNMVISDAAPAGAANQITVQFSGGNVVIADAAEQFTGVPATTPPSTLSPDGRTLTVPLAAFTGSVIIHSADGADTLTVDFSGGGSLPRGVAFDGGDPTSGPGDKLIVTNAVYGTLTLNHTSGSAGSVDVDGSVITYTGLEPVDITGSSGSNLVINLPDTSNTTSFGISGGNLIVDNTDGPPQTHEDGSIDLTDITSIEINAGGGNDTLTFLASFGGYTGSLNVDGEGGTDSLTFNSTLSLAAGSHFIAAAETIGVNNAIATAGAGTIVLLGTGSASLVSVNQILTTAGGSVTVQSDNDISFGAAGGISSIGGPVSVAADDGGGSGGAVTMADGAAIDADSGTITLFAYEDITLSLLRSTGLIYVWNYGAILDADAAGLDVDGGRVVFGPDLNVGTAANPIETRVSHLEAEAFVGGDIYVTNDGPLTIGGIEELGTLRSNGGDIGISATGDLTLQQTVDAGSGDVVLRSSSGAIVDDHDAVDPPHFYPLVDIIGRNVELNAVTGIGSLDALETEIATLDAYNDGAGNIRIDEMAAGGDLDVQQATVRGSIGSIWLTVARGNLTVLAGGDGVLLADEGNAGSIWLDANVTSAADEPLSGNVIVQEIVAGGDSVTITADHDVTGSAAGRIIAREALEIIAASNADAPGSNDNGTIQLAGNLEAGTVTFSLADCDGWIGDTPGSSDGNIWATNIVMGVDANAPEGVLQLQGDDNRFSDTTTVVEGTLIVNGMLTDNWPAEPPGGDGDVVVEAGGVLGGHGDGVATGVIAASITVLDGGILEPGDYLGCTPQTGRLTVDVPEDAWVDIRPGGTFRVQLGGPNFGTPVNGHDQLLLRGTATLNGAPTDGSGGGSLDVQVMDGYSVPAGAEYWLIDNDDEEDIDTRFLSLPEGAVLTAGGASLRISYQSYEGG